LCFHLVLVFAGAGGIAHVWSTNRVRPRRPSTTTNVPTVAYMLRSDVRAYQRPGLLSWCPPCLSSAAPRSRSRAGCRALLVARRGR
jgi:hypothetical protein